VVNANKYGCADLACRARGRHVPLINAVSKAAVVPCFGYREQFWRTQQVWRQATPKHSPLCSASNRLSKSLSAVPGPLHFRPLGDSRGQPVPGHCVRGAQRRQFPRGVKWSLSIARSPSRS